MDGVVVNVDSLTRAETDRIFQAQAGGVNQW
jgi:hypothetical protein